MASKFGGLEDKCKATVAHLKTELGRLRTGRASAAILEGVQVEYYGSNVPLQQMGMINVPEPRLITIQVFDASAVDAVEKAIRSAELGLNPARDGSLVRVSIPALTEDRRKDLVKKLGKTGEENRIVIRNHRRDAVEALKKDLKDKKISEDENRKQQEEIQKLTDKYTGEIDTAVTAKEKDIMSV